jgi:hypothetical protein
MTEIDWPSTERTMKWILSTFDCFVEACRSAPNTRSKIAMLFIIGDFVGSNPVPSLEEMTAPFRTSTRAW